MKWNQDDTFLARWLEGNLSPEDKKKFEQSQEGKEFLDLINATRLLKNPDYSVEGQLRNFWKRYRLQSLHVSKVFWKRPSFILAAACISMLIFVTYIQFFRVSIITTGFGEQQEVLLPAGSRVQLHVGTTLSYNESSWADNRSLNLDGEAFFEVKDGSTFIVETTNGQVEVLGTSFNIRVRGNLLDVRCYSGTVLVSNKHLKQKLQQGQYVRFRDLTVEELGTMNAQTIPIWMKGITELKNAPFDQVLQELQYVFGVNIDTSGGFKKLIYTGSFPNHDPDLAFELVFEPLGVEYRYDKHSRTLLIEGQ